MMNQGTVYWQDKLSDDGKKRKLYELANGDGDGQCLIIRRRCAPSFILGLEAANSPRDQQPRAAAEQLEDDAAALAPLRTVIM